MRLRSSDGWNEKSKPASVLMVESFQGGLNGSDPFNWFLRSSFISPEGPGPEEPIGTSQPPQPLPPGVWPIIGPELATDGVVQPIARPIN